MITVDELQAAIAECEGERNPNAQTCIKLAAYYTILHEKQGQPILDKGSYSFAPAPVEVDEKIKYNSDTEFAKLINGKSAGAVMELMDELMITISAIQPRLYDGVMRRLREI